MDLLAQTFTESGYEIKPVLRTLFRSDFFKNAQFAKIKSPAEVVVGTLRFVGGYRFPGPGIGNLAKEPGYMGQDLLNPPSVEGWHTGTEWINSGSLMKRINFSADMMGDTSKPGVQAIIGRLRDQGELDPDEFVDTCLDLMGPLAVDQANRQQLVDHAQETGDLRWATEAQSEQSVQRVGEMLQLVVSLREYQYN